MSETHNKESDIALLPHIALSVCHSSVVDSACDARQNRPGSTPPRAEFVTTAWPESSLQGTSIDLQCALTLTRLLKIIFVSFPLAPYSKFLVLSMKWFPVHSILSSRMVDETENHFLNYDSDTIVSTILFTTFHIIIASALIFFWCIVTELSL